ncbi:MAG TPA: dTDP-4-dehydrorhamnose 3,5-epimerase [Tenericutes bacterium]|nr:dTDP-4-dehydrorhamnose 3,5-epimerase [Mycoplasmatota bacterium]
MKLIKTELDDCYIIEPDKFGDERGYFSPFFIEKQLKDNNINFGAVVQCNRSLSSKGIVRGLHFQKNPKCQAKIVECLNGSVLDVVLDLREGSNTFGKWTSVLLTPENGRQLFVPRGFAHGFVSLEDNTLFQYLVDNDYSKEDEEGILWNDPDLNIDWKLEEYGIDNPILSDKDQNNKMFKDCPIFFKKGEI